MVASADRFLKDKARAREGIDQALCADAKGRGGFSPRVAGEVVGIFEPAPSCSIYRGIFRFNAVRLVPFVWYIDRLPIMSAARALKNPFGERYDGYGSRIRRWLWNLTMHYRPAIP
jgi:hypothetical protein